MSSSHINPAVMTPDPPITPEVIEKHGITVEEFDRIRQILGREPNFTELGIFSVMWSEHCSYKNSRAELKKFPTEGPRILIKAGEENAGVVDIGDGWGICFKMESHNHPSAVEPFQGAATGVGGIIRDIFTMGARPVFNMNSLRFGPITEAGAKSGEGEADPAQIKTNRRLFNGVVEGIAHYGNCIGIPTIGGEIYFDESYQGNPLVNVFCLGVLRHTDIRRGAAKGIGNPVFYVGAETGRDGLAGAAFASRELTDESHEDRPAVQVGDPFREKLLLEACLELFQTDAVAGVQDMGAAGLTCSTCETASRGNTGVEIDLALVPKREPGMTPYEILLSESQERMLIIVEKGKESIVEEIFEKWDLPYANIGTVRDDGQMRVKLNDDTAAEIPAHPLAEEAPLYYRDAEQPPAPEPLDLNALPEIDAQDALPRLLNDPNIASKNWVYRQYDHMVQTGTCVQPGSDAAVFYLREADKYLAATTDCNAIYCKLNPRAGGILAVMEAARNLACSGATPLALTDNLNFGNPHKPHNFYQLREAVEGMAEACRFFDAPVTGGNVSLYNENPRGAIDPTPTVGMVGLIENKEHITRQNWQASDDLIFLLGDFGDEMGGSHWLKVLHGKKAGDAPAADMEREKKLHQTLLELIRAGHVHSAHDCSEGGLAVALAECCFGNDFTEPLGAMIDLSAAAPSSPEASVSAAIDENVLLFNETQGRVIISVDPESEDAVRQILRDSGILWHQIGRTGGESLRIKTTHRELEWPVNHLRKGWWDSIGEVMRVLPVSEE